MFLLYFCFVNLFLFNSLNFNTKRVVSNLLGVSLLFPNNNLITSNSLIPIAEAAPIHDTHTTSSSYETSLVQIEHNNIYFYGSLNQQSSKALKDALNELISTSILFENKYDTKSPPIKLHIQSEGGSLLHSMYLVDIIKNSPIPIHTYVEGFAASAATLISVSGHKRFITENSLMLIHQLSSGSSGKYNELSDGMENFNTFMQAIKKIYFTYTKINPVELDELLKHDLWLSSDKCLEYGLVDEIVTKQ